MEDVVDALKLAASVFVFVLALALVFTVFSQAREVSEIVLNYSDNTYFASYTDASTTETNGRTVGIETVIPTLYRYYKEKFSVDIIIDRTNIYNRRNEKFDEEIERKVFDRADTEYRSLYEDGISWLKRSADKDSYYKDVKDRVSAYISQSAVDVNDTVLRKYSSTGLKQYRNSTFTETFWQVKNVQDGGILTADDGTVLELLKGTTKIYITYALN